MQKLNLVGLSIVKDIEKNSNKYNFPKQSCHYKDYFVVTDQLTKVRLSDNLYIILSTHKKNIFDQNQQFKAPIHFAAELGAYQIVQALLDAGECVNRLDGFGRSPLHYAAISGDIKTIRVILDKGGCQSALDCQNKNAIDFLTNLDAMHLFYDKSSQSCDFLEKLLEEISNIKEQKSDHQLFFDDLSSTSFKGFFPAKALLSNYSLSIAIIHKELLNKKITSRQADIKYLLLFISFIMVMRHSVSMPRFSLSNFIETLRLMAAFSNSISWDLKKCFCNIPWLNLRTLVHDSHC